MRRGSADSIRASRFRPAQQAGYKTAAYLSQHTKSSLQTGGVHIIAMGRHKIIELAMQLEPAERFEVAEELLRSVEQVDPEIDRLWLEEAERRLAAYRAGRIKGVPAEDIFGTF